jgi:transcriptional regulator with XRE-family HTH domain
MTPDPLNTEFARLLRRSGWTQAEAARELHLSPSTVSLYMSGGTRPSVTVIQLFKVLTGDTSPLPGRKRAGRATHEDELMPLDERETALLRALRALDGPRRQQLLRHFREIAGMLQAPAQPGGD